MNRRSILAASSFVVAAAALNKASAAAATHNHMAPDAALITSALNCIKTGELCKAHCVMMLEQGDTSMAACHRNVNETIAVCQALVSLAAQGSHAIHGMAKVALDVCKNCEKECRKLERKHSVCKDCADACAACAKECARVAA
jgi:Cys-rich four helix bundle protein (predicted Tat secretion target)